MIRTRMFVNSSFADRRFFGGGGAGTEARHPQPGYDRMTGPHHSPEPRTLPIDRPDNQTIRNPPARATSGRLCRYAANSGMAEHRQFCCITRTGAAIPLTDRLAVVELIGATTTRTGFRVECALDTRT